MIPPIVVLGAGISPFTKPSAGHTYAEVALTAVRAALVDAGISYADVQYMLAGYIYGDSGCGQRVAYEIGLPGIPVVNVNNNCATGSTAVSLARGLLLGGQADCVLALGFEQMPRGAVTAMYSDRPYPQEKIGVAMTEIQGYDPDIPGAAQFFGGAGREYLARYGTSPETLARIAVKSRAHGARNPNAIFRQPVTVEEVLASPMVFSPLTRLQCCPPTTGAAAVVLASRDFARHRGLKSDVRLIAQALTTDQAGSFEPRGMMGLVGYDMTRRAARSVYESAGVGPEDVDVVELHDCFTTNELISYEGLGLTPEGTAESFVAAGDNTYGGKVVVNPSGGLLSKGHPIGATGVAQVAELTWQLRGQAGARQVEGARMALQHNVAPGTACVVTLLGAA